MSDTITRHSPLPNGPEQRILPGIEAAPMDSVWLTVKCHSKILNHREGGREEKREGEGGRKGGRGRERVEEEEGGGKEGECTPSQVERITLQ